MGNKLYVGNLAYSVRDESLQAAFGQFGTVTSANAPPTPRSGTATRSSLLTRPIWSPRQGSTPS